MTCLTEDYGPRSSVLGPRSVYNRNPQAAGASSMPGELCPWLVYAQPIGWGLTHAIVVESPPLLTWRFAAICADRDFNDLCSAGVSTPPLSISLLFSAMFSPLSAMRATFSKTFTFIAVLLLWVSMASVPGSQTTSVP